MWTFRKAWQEHNVAPYIDSHSRLTQGVLQYAEVAVDQGQRMRGAHWPPVSDQPITDSAFDTSAPLGPLPLVSC
jgi:hypothetical protein